MVGRWQDERDCESSRGRASVLTPAEPRIVVRIVAYLIAVKWRWSEAPAAFPETGIWPRNERPFDLPFGWKVYNWRRRFLEVGP